MFFTPTSWSKTSAQTSKPPTRQPFWTAIWKHSSKVTSCLWHNLSRSEGIGSEFWKTRRRFGMSETPSCFIERAFQPNKTAIFLSNSAKHFFRLEKTREKTLKQTERLSLLFLPNRYSRSQNLIECPVFTELFYLGRRKRHSIFCVWRSEKTGLPKFFLVGNGIITPW